MSSHKELVNEFVATQDPLIQNEKVQKLVNLLHQNELTLLNFIQSLQMYITSNNDQIRITIFKLLSEVLNKLSPTKLYPKDIEVLINFLYSKLSDKPVMKYVLLSIYSLVSMNFFDKTSANNVLNNLIEHYNPKEHPQSVRLTALKITNLIITTCSKDQYDNNTFILCYLHVSQNEKDPNNLLLIFQLLKEISKTLEINQYSQQLFDTMFRYYPISFKSANQAQEAQVDSLKDSLNSSLASNDIFGQELFPNLIDKFNSSTSNQVKMDILTTISTVSQLYSPHVIQEHFMPLWNTLKYTIINQEVANQISIPKILAYYENSTNESDQIFHSTLIALKHLSSKINFEGKLLVFDDLSNNLIVTERNRRFLQSYLTLAIVCLPSTYLEDETDQVLQKTLKALFSDEQPLDQIRNKRLILTVLSYFTLNSKFTSELYQYRDQIMNIIQASLSTSDLETTLKGLTIQLITTLILSPKFKGPAGFEIGLLDEEKDILVGELTDLLIGNSLKDVIDFNAVIEKELLMSLAKLAKVNENENLIANQVINKIMIYLRDDNVDLLYKCKLLNHLMKISQTQSLIQNVSIRLINLLETDSFNAELVMQSLSSLFSYLPMSYNTQPIIKKFVAPLFEYIFTTNKEDEIIYVSEIVRRLTVGLNVEDSKIFISEIFNVFSGFLNLPELKSSAEFSFSSKNINPQVEHLPILLYALQGLSNNVELNGLIDCTLLVESLKSVKFEKGIRQLTKLQVNVGVATLFNKYMNYNNFDSAIDNESTSMEFKIWALYGLILKNEAEAIKRFVKLMDNLPFKQSLKAIDIIFTPIKEVYDSEDIEGIDLININRSLDYDVELLIAFKKEMESMFMMRKQSKLNICNLTIRNIWKQRTLEVLLSNEDLNSEKIDLIIPMVLTYLPEEIYSVHLQKLLPNLIKTIQTCEDNKIIISILIIIQNILKEESGKVYLKPYIDTVMKIAIENAESKNKQLQIQSLKCILNITTFSLPLIVPYKKRVIKLCADLLDDKSRSVRTLAVTVRQSWEDLGLDLSI